MVTRSTHYHPDHPHPDTRGALLLSRLPQGETHGAHKHDIRTTSTNASGWFGHPDTFAQIIDWSKKVLHVITNSLSWPTFRHLQSERTRWSDNKSLPTITSHDHLPRSLSAARRVMMALPPPSVIMTTQNISPPLKRETKLLILYIWTFTQRGR